MCVSGLFHVRLEKCYKSSFTSLAPCWSLLSKCLYAHTGIPSSPLLVLCDFLGMGLLCNQVYLPQLLWARKTTLILSKLFFSLLCIHRFSFTHSHTRVHRHREVYAQAIWSGSLGMAEWIRDTRYQVFH